MEEKTADFFRIIASIIIPPVGVFLQVGLGLHFWLNILLITYIVDVEQIVLPDISGDWEYPLWPPAFWVDIIHWYGRNFDPVLIARPVWWRLTIWIDSLFFGPFYVFGIYY